jgi:hypothetical protein
MGIAWGPSHLLLFYKPLGNELIDRRFNETRRYALSAPMPFPVVDDTRRVVIDWAAVKNINVGRNVKSYRAVSCSQAFFRRFGVDK